MFDGTLRDVWENGISAAESDDRSFTEKDPFAENRGVRAKQERCEHNRRPPDEEPRDRHTYRAWERRPGMLWRRVFVIDDRRFAALVGRNDLEFCRPDFSTGEANYSRADNDRRERRTKKINRDEGEDGDRPEDLVL